MKSPAPYSCLLYKRFSNDPILVTVYEETDQYYVVTRVDLDANWDLPIKTEKLYKPEWNKTPPEPVKATPDNAPSYFDFLDTVQYDP